MPPIPQPSSVQEGGFWLSVLVPMYKVEEYLDECLASILDQADPGVEVLICDDGSPDGSIVIARHYADRYPDQVRIITHERNSGLAATRNTLIAEARGAYLWFVDSDDSLRPGAIAAVAAVVRAHAPDLIGCNYRKRRIPKSAFTGRSHQLLTDRDVIASGICASRKMYAWVRISKRTLWTPELRFPVGKVFEDAAVTPSLSLRARSYVHIRRPLLDYRIRPGSILSRIRSGPFDVQAHRDLAGALEGFAESLAREDEPFVRTRFAISHFIAMEFAKIVGRVLRSDETVIDGLSKGEVIAEFRTIMERSSPIPFPALVAQYLRTGRWIAWVQLRRALAQTDPKGAGVQAG